MLLARIAQLGAFLLYICDRYGRFNLFCLSTARWAFIDMLRPRRWRLLWPQLYEVGTRSISVVALVGTFIGMVLAVELFDSFKRFGTEAGLGGVIGISVVKNIGPVLAAIMLAGRVGGAFSAELGTMAVTEQLDAMRVMATDPVSYLVVPRVLACVIMIPMLTIYADVCGIFGGWFITVEANHVTNVDYWTASARAVGPWEITTGLVKSLCFGAAIGLISCYKGCNSEKGAQGVGRATTDAFVTSFIAIIILNFFLAMFMKDFYNFIFGFAEFDILG